MRGVRKIAGFSKIMSRPPQIDSGHSTRPGVLLLFDRLPGALPQRNRKYKSGLRDGLAQTIQAISPAVDLRDAYAHGHQERVAAFAAAIAHAMHLPENEVSEVYVAAIVRDIGKLKLPAKILAKPGALSEFEHRLMQRHAQAGRDILKDITFPWAIADIVWQHHERLDGSGYPRGLRGDEILIGARVVAVADVVEAMATRRPYRPALGIDVALAEIEKNRGAAFDPAVVDACLQLLRTDSFTFRT
jgi:HD-GYP domain-containing protein (c-di-GMP phosphodiesterase class II)